MLLGIFIGLGVITGALIGRSLYWLRSEIQKLTFGKSGFVFARCGLKEGWLSRDRVTNEWIFWSIELQQMYRGQTSDALLWEVSPETEEECMRIGIQYAKLSRVP